MYVISCSNFDFRIQIFDMCRTRMHTKKIREEKHVEKPAELRNICVLDSKTLGTFWLWHIRFLTG